LLKISGSEVFDLNISCVICKKIIFEGTGFKNIYVNMKSGKETELIIKAIDVEDVSIGEKIFIEIDIKVVNVSLDFRGVSFSQETAQGPNTGVRKHEFSYTSIGWGYVIGKRTAREADDSEDRNTMVEAKYRRLAPAAAEREPSAVKGKHGGYSESSLSDAPDTDASKGDSPEPSSAPVPRISTNSAVQSVPRRLHWCGDFRGRRITETFSVNTGSEPGNSVSDEKATPVPLPKLKLSARERKDANKLKARLAARC